MAIIIFCPLLLSTSHRLFFPPTSSDFSTLLYSACTGEYTTWTKHTRTKDVGPFFCPPASLKPKNKGLTCLLQNTCVVHPHKPLLCAANGAARHILYISGSSDEGRPVHWHRFSWSAILLRQMNTGCISEIQLPSLVRVKTETVCQTLRRQRGRGDLEDNCSEWKNNCLHYKNRQVDTDTRLNKKTSEWIYYSLWN